MGKRPVKNKDYELYDEALQALKEVRPWVSSDYYRMHIAKTVDRLKERLATLEVDKYVEDKNQRYLATVDYKPAQETVHQNVNSNYNITMPTDEPDTVPDGFGVDYDTVPNKLVEITSNFGLFNSFENSEHCKNHPDAPHEYLKELSINMGRYVCKCEFWSPEKS